jgi:ubiquinone/menaquinone biosynthesis C-methylase UbiE/uncharacterized protein YbaR (Trm112 family)
MRRNDQMISPRQLQLLYEQGKNITEILRDEKGLQINSTEIIEIAYDLQAGSYIAGMNNPENAVQRRHYSTEIARTIQSLCQPRSILEAGVGEATTLSGVLKHFEGDVTGFGFDLSWSRAAYAKRWLQSQGRHNVTLCVGDLFHIPFGNNSVDIVYTSHSIEPNGGNEEPILRELFRVTRRFLVLLEPCYELANDEARLRMDSHGYCKNLPSIAKNLGYDVLRHEFFTAGATPLNPTAITIIKKDVECPPPTFILACPRSKRVLEETGGMLFSPEALVVYPIVGGIPCLRPENGVFASKYKEMICDS